MKLTYPINLQANTEQVRPAPDKYNTKYYIEAFTLNISNKDNHLWNDMITVHMITDLEQVTLTKYPNQKYVKEK